MDEKQPYQHLPIPTYEEATSSRPQSSQSRLGPQEISDDAERQGLLSSNYAAPTVESERSSLDSLDGIEVESEADLRREILQMDIEDPLNDQSSSRSSLLSNQFKRFTSFTTSLQSLTLPSFRRFIPSLPFRVPHIDWQALDSNRVVILGRLVGVIILGGLMYTLIATDIITFGNKRNMFMFRPDQVRNFILDNIKEHSKAQEYLQRITEYPHMAGTEGNYVLGEWVFELFKQGGLEDVSMERFDVYLNYPQKDGRRVAIVDPPELAWEAQIEEDNEADYVFHGHSASGNVIGPLVYANFGSPQDFQRLQDMGIDVKGAIVLVRYYGSQGDRALKVKAAELAGAVGCIIYSDPAQDGFVQGPTFPDGRYMPADGVQRGAVSLMSWVVGDVLSPGFASTPSEKKRLDIDESEGLNKIPSIPLSWNDAQHLLTSMHGHGTKMDGDWVGAPDVEYWTGDASSPRVNLKNIQDEETHQPIYNILGRIIGWEQPTRKIIVGNHRDAWCSGAADPGSGTVILLEVIRHLGELQKTGWKPLRTIEFANWDGEEYNLIGSTEHVENRWHELHETGIAYINLDTAVTGIDLRAAASPMLHKAFMHALERIEDPASNRSLHEIWLHENKRLSGLGAGSDYVAFQDLVGMSSIDLSFQGQQFPYHSCYDSYEWMTQYGDPDFSYHRTMAQIVSLLILELSDHALLPLDIESYASSLHEYVNDLDKDVNKPSSTDRLDLTSLRAAVDLLSVTASTYTEFDNAWHSLVFSSGGFESSIMGLKRIDRNENLANFESYLLDTEGLVNRTQFKHVIFGPQKWSGYDEAYFPGIRDYVEIGEYKAAQSEVNKVAAILERAVGSLVLA